MDKDMKIYAYQIWESFTRVKISRFQAQEWHQEAILWQASFGYPLQIITMQISVPFFA